MVNPIDELVTLAKEYNSSILVVSKNRTNDKIKALYDQGFRHMGENRVQSLIEKKDDLPSDIKWHVIGHLQKNKVKYIAEFVELIHSVDSLELASKINSEAKKHNRIISILLQLKVAEEESKYGIVPHDIDDFLTEFDNKELTNLRVDGIMGMASFTNDKEQIRREFKQLKTIFDQLKKDHFGESPHFTTLSMGMSADYEIALEEGSTLLRLGSILF